MYTDVQKSGLKQFFDACDEMIEGRFILSDVKVARILKSVAQSDVLYDLFAKCLVHFNFNNEFEAAKSTNRVNGGYFVMPNEDSKIIALVFCFLLEVDKGKINLQNFVNDNFYNPEGYNISYSNFSINMLVPFKNAVMNMLGCDQEGNVAESKEPVDNLPADLPVEHTPNEKLLYANLLRSLNELYMAADNAAKLHAESREEMLIIIRAMQDAIKLQNLRIINALCIPLEYMTKKNKYLRSFYDVFKEDLVSFYYK